MNQITTRNAVILALTQIGAVVIGVLAAGATHKWYTLHDAILGMPSTTTLFADYGYVALALPLIWLTMTLLIQRRNDVPEATKLFAFCFGIILLLLILLGVWFAALGPWLRLIGSFD